MNIAFPALSGLLLSLVNLVHLLVWDSPPSSYVSPEAMVHCIAAMTRLESLYLGFRSPRPPSRRSGRLPPPTRINLSALFRFEYNGTSEYLEDIVARINAPLVRIVRLKFFNQILFNISQLPQFVEHADHFKVLDRADMVFSRRTVEIRLLSRRSQEQVDRTILVMGVSCRASDWQLSSLAQVCASSSRHLSTIEHLEIHEGSTFTTTFARRYRERPIDRTFTTVLHREECVLLRGSCSTRDPSLSGAHWGT